MLLETAKRPRPESAPSAFRGSLALPSACLTSGLRTMRQVLCSKPPSSWYFVMGALRKHADTIFESAICAIGFYINSCRCPRTLRSFS